MILNRRRFISNLGASAGASLFLKDRILAAEDKPDPKGNHFLLYIHFGSNCGLASGLIQPRRAGEWMKGCFREGSVEGCVNEHVNRHTAAGQLVFHDYIKYLKEISSDMCLVAGNPQSLDHTVGRAFQTCGMSSPAFGPEWAMGFAQNMLTENRRNPLVLTPGGKSSSVVDITTLGARSVDEFRLVTQDAVEVNKIAGEPIWKVLKERFATVRNKSVLLDPALGSTSNYQINTLLNGIPELENIKADIESLSRLMADEEIGKIVDTCPDSARTRSYIRNSNRELLILAGAMAKSGIANGMTMEIEDSADLHIGGTDLQTTAASGAVWAQIMVLWKWLKSQGLDRDVMIIVGQEFARSPYNGSVIQGTIKNAGGKDVEIKAYGRDHGISMGTMFINSKVPSAGRIGIVADNLIPLASKDAMGTPIMDSPAYTSESIVGSMLMRVFDDLFPTERIVRGHWPTFVPISTILDAK